MDSILKIAYNNNFAVPAINFESFEVLKALAFGAAKCNSPIIVQTTEPALSEMGIVNIVHMVEYYKKSLNIPIVLHLDHATDMDTISQCIDAGYRSVMIDASGEDFTENVGITKKVVEYAHNVGVVVESEIGIVGGNGIDDCKTNVESAVEFVNETGVDSLAISVGNSHGGRVKNKEIDFDLLNQINEKLCMPLVLHGSSGVVNKDLQSIINYGVCKVNIETELRALYHNALETFLKNNPEEIRIRKINAYLNMVIESLVEEKCKLFRCANKKEIIM